MLGEGTEFVRNSFFGRFRSVFFFLQPIVCDIEV